MPIIIKGLTEFNAALNGIKTSINDTAIAQALKEAGTQLVQQAQSRAPVATGFLRDNIKITEEAADRVVVTSEAEYSIYVEEGTYKMPARPFMMPSAQEIENTFPSIMGAKIKTAITEHLH